MVENNAKKTCFVVSPIGATGSLERIHADWLLDAIIIPVFTQNYQEYDVLRADKMPAPGMIDSQIIEHLLDAELVIADITTLNPNVFYEIGIRHVANKPIVHMVLENNPIPFDVKIFKHIEFSIKTPQDLEIAKARLKAQLDAVFGEGFKVDNPVTRTRTKVEFERTATAPEKVIQTQIDELAQRLFTIESERFLRGYAPKTTREAERVHRYLKDGWIFESEKAAFEIVVKGPSALSTRQLYEAIEAKARRYFDSFSMSEFSGSEDTVVFSVPVLSTNMENIVGFQRELIEEGYKVRVKP